MRFLQGLRGPLGRQVVKSQRRLEYQAVVARFAGDAFAVKIFQ